MNLIEFDQKWAVSRLGDPVMLITSNVYSIVHGKVIVATNTAAVNQTCRRRKQAELETKHHLQKGTEDTEAGAIIKSRLVQCLINTGGGSHSATGSIDPEDCRYYLNMIGDTEPVVSLHGQQGIINTRPSTTLQ